VEGTGSGLDLLIFSKPLEDAGGFLGLDRAAPEPLERAAAAAGGAGRETSVSRRMSMQQGLGPPPLPGGAAMLPCTVTRGVILESRSEGNWIEHTEVFFLKEVMGQPDRMLARISSIRRGSHVFT
jgi:hypothetical protein